MRSTAIKSLILQRFSEWDPNYHNLITKKVDFQLVFSKKGDDESLARLRLKVEFFKEGQSPYGLVEVESETNFNHVSFPWTTEGRLDIARAPENVKRLVEGAIAEDVLLPVSVAARALRLPSILPIPMVFERPEETAAPRPRKVGNAKP